MKTCKEILLGKWNCSVNILLGNDKLIDAETLKTLRRNAGKTSYKRGSDDLHEYLANYDEVRESLAEYPCLLDLLEILDETEVHVSVLIRAPRWSRLL